MLAHILPLRTAVFLEQLHRSRSYSASPGVRSPSNARFIVQVAVLENRTSMNCVRRLGGCCFASQHRKTLKSESGCGGEDVFDSTAMESGGKPEHLVIMVNGIIGSSADWKFAAQQFVKKLPDRVIVHCSECNYSKLTFDGVDLMGERLAEEVLSVIRYRTGVRKISFVAHSLGGLVARYAIGKLYEEPLKAGYSNPPQFFDDGRIAGLEAMNFITFATPHLGSRGRKQYYVKVERQYPAAGNPKFPLLCGLPFLETRALQTAHLVAGRSGKHLFLMDNDDGKPPLLLQMTTDCSELKFISALRAFKRRVAYANVNYDYMVGWSTSSIRHQNELPNSNVLSSDAKYPHIVYAEQGNANLTCPKSSIIDDTTYFEEEMIKGLTQVPWERVDVSFHQSKQRYVAHSTIQVKTYWLNSDGVDVVNHMIDSFLL